MTKCMGKEPGNPEGLQLMAEALQCALGAWLGSIPALGGACSRQGHVRCGWSQPRAWLCLLEPLCWGRGCAGSSQLLRPLGRTRRLGWEEGWLHEGRQLSRAVPYGWGVTGSHTPHRWWQGSVPRLWEGLHHCWSFLSCSRCQISAICPCTGDSTVPSNRSLCPKGAEEKPCSQGACWRLARADPS